MRKFPGLPKWIYVLVFMLFAAPVMKVHAQSQDVKDVNAHSPVPSQGNKKQRKADKKKADQKKLAEKAIEKGKKRHEKLQTKEVRKRMKKSKRTAAANNAHKREFFLKRWFTPDHRTKRR